MATKKIKWFQKDGSLLHPETEVSQIVDFPTIKTYTASTGISISTSNAISTTAASSTASGHVSTGAQTFAGRKTFNGGINIPSAATLQVNGSSGTSGYVLTSNGTGSAPTWKALPEGIRPLDAYPVGSIYLSWYYASSTSDTHHPAKLFGGSWTMLGGGRSLWTWMEKISSSDAAQHTIDAGLPNITGFFDSVITSGGSRTVLVGGPPFSENMEGGNPMARVTLENWNYLPSNRITFDASGVNAIYGKSTTVQPPAYKVFAWRRTA